MEPFYDLADALKICWLLISLGIYTFIILNKLSQFYELSTLE